MRKISLQVTVATLAMAGLLAGGTLPVQAQVYFGSHFGVHRFSQEPVLPERAIVQILRQDGFRRLSPPVLNRDVYVLDAVDPYGDPVRVIVGAYDGRILQAHRQREARWVHPDPFGNPFDDERLTPTPPQAAPRVLPRKQALAPVAPPALKEKPLIAPQAPKAPPTVLKKTPPAIPGSDAAKPIAPVAGAQAGTKVVPRVIEMTPPALLDEAQRTPGPATPQVPPAALE